MQTIKKFWQEAKLPLKYVNKRNNVVLIKCIYALFIVTYASFILVFSTLIAMSVTKGINNDWISAFVYFCLSYLLLVAIIEYLYIFRKISGQLLFAIWLCPILALIVIAIRIFKWFKRDKKAQIINKKNILLNEEIIELKKQVIRNTISVKDYKIKLKIILEDSK